MTQTGRLLLYAQLAFWGCVLVCFVVAGGGLSHNHGFGVYGGKWSTIVPWAVGFVAAASLILRAAAHSDRVLALGLRLIVVFSLGILFTPDSIDTFFQVAFGVLIVSAASERELASGFRTGHAGDPLRGEAPGAD